MSKRKFGGEFSPIALGFILLIALVGYHEATLQPWYIHRKSIEVTNLFNTYLDYAYDSARSDTFPYAVDVVSVNDQNDEGLVYVKFGVLADEKSEELSGLERGGHYKFYLWRPGNSGIWRLSKVEEIL